MKLKYHKHTQGGSAVQKGSPWKSDECREYCAYRSDCTMVDFRFSDNSCIVHTQPGDLIDVTEKTTGQKDYLSVSQYKKEGSCKSIYHPLV
jgi:hypothetical protein